MAELVVAALELCIRDPHWHAIALLQHALINGVPELRSKWISIHAQRPDPQLLLQLVIYAIDGVLEPAIAARVGIDTPRLSEFVSKRAGGFFWSTGTGAASLDSRLTVIGMGGLEFARGWWVRKLQAIPDCFGSAR
jgi:hypothetical protein